MQQIDTPESIYRNPANAFVAGFVGENNLLTGTAVQTSPGMATVRLPDGSTVEGRMQDTNVTRNSDVLVVLRPDSIEVQPGKGAGIAGRVRVVQFLGSKVRYIVELVETGRRVDIDAPLAVERFDVRLTWRRDDA